MTSATRSDDRMGDERATASSATSAPATSAVAAGEGLRGRAIVIARDGSEAARSATEVARALAADRGALPHVVRALDVSSWPVPQPMPYLVNVASALLAGDVEKQHAEALKRELEAEHADMRDWPIDVETGTAATLVSHAAQRVDAALVLMGLRRHGPVDRLAHDETTLHAMASSPCPVLGVVEGLRAQPSRIVVGMDFSRASIRAASAALDIVARDGTLYLAYVRPSVVVAEDEIEGEALIHDLGVRAAFEKVSAKLANARGVRLETVVVDAFVGAGGSAGELRHVAERVHADVVAVGSRRHSTIDRLVLGSVTRDLVRTGTISVLAVPPEATARAL